jgi:hypothetical protein
MASRADTERERRAATGALLDRLAREEWARLAAIARAHGAERDAVADVVQAGLLAVLRSYRGPLEAESIRCYACRCVQTETWRLHRRRRRRESQDVGLDSVAELAADVEPATLVLRAEEVREAAKSGLINSPKTSTRSGARRRSRRAASARRFGSRTSSSRARHSTSSNGPVASAGRSRTRLWRFTLRPRRASTRSTRHDPLGNAIQVRDRRACARWPEKIGPVWAHDPNALSVQHSSPKARSCRWQGFPSAAERSRTSTALAGHKALNLVDLVRPGPIRLVQAVSGALSSLSFAQIESTNKSTGKGALDHLALMLRRRVVRVDERGLEIAVPHPLLKRP